MDSLELSPPKIMQSETGPLVSVILATYEPPETITQALQSVFEQTYNNVELVIVDSSGVDQLKEIADDHRWVQYVRQDPVGVAAAWNAGIEASTGDLVSFLADDDYYHPTKLERQVEAIQNGADIVYSDVVVINPDGTEIRLSSLPVGEQSAHYIEYFKRGDGVPHLTVLGRRKCFRKNQFNENLDAREDPHLWVRLFKQYSAVRIADPLAYKRRREGSLTSNLKLVYKCEQCEIDDLLEKYEELRPYENIRRRRAKYRHAKRLLTNGRAAEARKHFFDIVWSGPTEINAVVLLCVSLLPQGHGTAFTVLEQIDQRLRRLIQ